MPAAADPTTGNRPGAKEEARRCGTTVSRSEVGRHQSSTSLWAVVDNEWVVDVTNFVRSHPGGEKIFTATLGSNFSFSSGPNAHFRTTQLAFKAACASFMELEQEQVASVGKPIRVDVQFWRSRLNGGLDRDGKEVGSQPREPQGTATIIGRLAK